MAWRTGAIGVAMALAIAPGLSAGQTTTAGAGARSSQSVPAVDESRSGGSVTLATEATLEIAGLPRRGAVEFRPRLRIDLQGQPGAGVRYRADVDVRALAADRGGRALDAVVVPRDLWIEWSGAAGDIRAGFGRLVWGRLDEIQPSDVINPIDTALFLLDGRSEARRAVAFVRGRVSLGEVVEVEGVFAPVFRRSVFDALEEPTSPFNLALDAPRPAPFAGLPIERAEPGRAWRNVSGGARLTTTIGAVDVGASVYRGFEGFGLVQPVMAVPPATAVARAIVETFPRFTMVAADVETVAGEWAVRGEVASFDTRLPGVSRPGDVEGRVVEGGVGFDRRVGSLRVFGSGLLRRESSAGDAGVGRTNVNLVGSVERAFRRDEVVVRVFVVANPPDRTGFVRGLLTWRFRDNWAIESSAGAFVGTGDDTLSRFRGRDFLLVRLRWWGGVKI
jgi:hypothetical protein